MTCKTHHNKHEISIIPLRSLPFHVSRRSQARHKFAVIFSLFGWMSGEWELRNSRNINEGGFPSLKTRSDGGRPRFRGRGVRILQKRKLIQFFTRTSSLAKLLGLFFVGYLPNNKLAWSGENEFRGLAGPLVEKSHFFMRYRSLSLKWNSLYFRVNGCVIRIF